jgi:hypothetical protein
MEPWPAAQVSSPLPAQPEICGCLLQGSSVNLLAEQREEAEIFLPYPLHVT